MMNESEGTAGCRERRFTELFGAHYSSVLAYARRRLGPDLAQDVVAETFLAAWRNLDQLPPRPLPWLYGTAQFAIANRQRAIARRGRLDNRARRLRAGDALAWDHTEEIVADMELAAALRSLTEADMEILRLAAWEGLTATAIGTVVGCSAVAAKARLYRRQPSAVTASPAQPSPRPRRPSQPVRLWLPLRPPPYAQPGHPARLSPAPRQLPPPLSSNRPLSSPSPRPAQKSAHDPSAGKPQRSGPPHG
jgi:RNA polymerase sigma-70 factor (ECF subfamily)